MRFLKLSGRLYGLILLSVLVIMATLYYSLYLSNTQMADERKALLSSIDDSVISILNDFQAQEVAGKLSHEEAQQRAIETVKVLRYGANGYVWINDLDARMIMHPIKPELNGKDLTSMKDPNGKQIFVEFAKTASTYGSGFVSYYWPKPGVDKPVAKLSHVALFKPWGWVVGNGVYIDDLDRIYWQHARNIGSIAVIGGLFMVLGAIAIIRSVVKPLNRLGTAMRFVAEEDFTREIPDTGRHDEMGSMAKTLVLLRDSIRHRVEIREQKALEQDARLSEEREQNDSERLTRANDLQLVIEELGAGLQRLSNCDISQPIDRAFAEEFDILRRDFNQSLSVFNETMSKVLHRSGEVDRNAADLQQQAGTMTVRTERQAASLEQTAAAVVQITANVKSTADRTQSTRNNAKEMTKTVGQSTVIVVDAIHSIERIEEASLKISTITSVIDEIAFQTNLLALNAGVEAARAGDAGKGFAVVAQEVRELAQRSARAAKEIGGLIAQSTSEVRQGVELVKKTGSSLKQVETQILEISSDIEAIASAGREQSIGLTEVNQAIHVLDRLTQENAAMSAETQNAILRLVAVADDLSSAVGTFRIDVGPQAASEIGWNNKDKNYRRAS